MSHYLDYMDKIYNSVVAGIKEHHTDWKIDRNFAIYREITPKLEGVDFQTTMQLRKRSSRTSVIFEQDYNERKTLLYLTEYNIVEKLIYIYDNFVNEGDLIFSGLLKLIEDSGTDVFFKIEAEPFSFKGIQYLSDDKLFLSSTDYQIGINDFIALLNLVIEKDRYSKESENGKGTIRKYLSFLLFCSSRTQKHKSDMENMLNEINLYRGNSLNKYRDVINGTGEKKLYLKKEHLENII